MRNFILFFIEAASFSIPTNGVQGCSFSISLPTLVLCFLTIAILREMKWYLIVVWLTFPTWLVASIFSNTCWPVVCLLWGNIYSSHLPIFKSCYLFSWYGVVGVPYIFYILMSYQIWGRQIFFPFHRLPFYLFASFAIQKLVSSWFLLPLLLLSYSWSHCQEQCCEAFPIHFLLRLL